MPTPPRRSGRKASGEARHHGWSRGVGVALAIAIASGASHARAGFGAPRGTGDDEWPARRYAGLDRDACEAQLAQRGIPFAHVEEARGVLAPVALTPDYNWAHRNHFHLEVAAGAKWSMVR